MLSPRQKFWFRTLLEIVIGFFLLGPLLGVIAVAAELDFLHQNRFLNSLFVITIRPWTPAYAMVDGSRGWVWLPYLSVTGLLILHTIFARERFPRWSKSLRRVRPFAMLAIVSYFATIWSRLFIDSTFWRCMNSTEFSFACERLWTFPPLLTFVVFWLYFFAFSALWFGGKKIMQARQGNQKMFASPNPSS